MIIIETNGNETAVQWKKEPPVKMYEAGSQLHFADDGAILWQGKGNRVIGKNGSLEVYDGDKKVAMIMLDTKEVMMS